MMRWWCSLLCLAAAAQPAQQVVRSTRGLVALWDFVERDAEGRFDAWQPAGSRADLHLDALNYVRQYWNQGRAATYDDFPMHHEGPFGQAIEIRSEADGDFRPLLQVDRARLQGSRLDVKGRGGSVSMVVWVKRASGNHALAGIWHEGTDLGGAARSERGQRQYALFAGLAANDGAVAAHISENGGSSFGDKYARNLAVTPEVLPARWVAAGFTFDNARHTLTAYCDGRATELWIDHPQAHPFFQWAARGWADGSYLPPESRAVSMKVLEEREGRRVELQTFAFTKVRVTYRDGYVVSRELVALRVNPYWFGHDIYTPESAAEGGPFTIGRVIHTGRSVGFSGLIGGVAVFDRALSAREMARLAAIARPGRRGR